MNINKHIPLHSICFPWYSLNILSFFCFSFSLSVICYSYCFFFHSCFACSFFLTCVIFFVVIFCWRQVYMANDVVLLCHFEAKLSAIGHYILTLTPFCVEESRCGVFLLFHQWKLESRFQSRKSGIDWMKERKRKK